MRNMNGIFNKEELIENTMKVNIYYQRHRERMKIDVIRGQKWNMILGMLWLTCHNSDIDVLSKPQVMYFGLCNSPETFQRMMNSIFRKLLYEEVLANYMDDFIIPAKTKEELEERTIRFLKIAEKHNLCFKWSKYDFDMEEIPILEVIVGKGQVKIEQKKIKTVKKWKTLTKTKDIESFLKFAKFYR